MFLILFAQAFSEIQVISGCTEENTFSNDGFLYSRTYTVNANEVRCAKGSYFIKANQDFIVTYKFIDENLGIETSEETIENSYLIVSSTKWPYFKIAAKDSSQQLKVTLTYVTGSTSDGNNYTWGIFSTFNSFVRVFHIGPTQCINFYSVNQNLTYYTVIFGDSRGETRGSGGPSTRSGTIYHYELMNNFQDTNIIFKCEIDPVYQPDVDKELLYDEKITYILPNNGVFMLDDLIQYTNQNKERVFIDLPSEFAVCKEFFAPSSLHPKSQFLDVKEGGGNCTAGNFIYKSFDSFTVSVFNHSANNDFKTYDNPFSVVSGDIYNVIKCSSPYKCSIQIIPIPEPIYGNNHVNRTFFTTMSDLTFKQKIITMNDKNDSFIFIAHNTSDIVLNVKGKNFRTNIYKKNGAFTTDPSANNDQTILVIPYILDNSKDQEITLTITIKKATSNYNLDKTYFRDSVFYEIAGGVQSEDELKRNKPEIDSGGLSGGAIAGIVIAIILVVAIVSVLVWFFIFRKKSEKNGTEAGDNI
ncbi:hypothetical protein TVAG_362850 [Trichomonas vaginalis G3]|uniref:Uncharacterized protein n=1 Tax=Trichomonas vaginalis (strain ATCC PRA-98 / G3) TaxID=412133 RepID=A2E662_TRIV3|nr:glycoprotein 38 family [Trichomonas vaginalis G3]EAY11904.1 hypothetical protein TVAG_362850 [Trichomonas vaginalis G3]KAI5532325.1 glycoprotein 38 family [Trichomonas vaginalis G3]|eukprot:XP_001324127.1 hypothetical protein [Trichomonas vaginalis G3]